MRVAGRRVLALVSDAIDPDIELGMEDDLEALAALADAEDEGLADLEALESLEEPDGQQMERSGEEGSEEEGLQEWDGCTA